MAAVEWAVDKVEPRLKRFGNYPDGYLKPVAHAIEYAHALAAKVPGPISVTLDSYAADPLVHALFHLPEDLQSAFDASRAMDEFQRQNPSVTEVYGLVCMRRNIKKMFGMEMRGDILRRDVDQEAVYFTDFTLAEPGLTEAESRQRIAEGFFKSLVGHVANRISALKTERARDEIERDEWLSRMRGAKLEAHAEAQAGLEAVLRRLTESVHDLELGRYHHHFEAVLLNPEKFLYLEQTEMNLDSMGIVRKPNAAGSDEIEFCDLIGRDRRRWTVALLYCNHVKPRSSISDKLANAQRWLGF